MGSINSDTQVVEESQKQMSHLAFQSKIVIALLIGVDERPGGGVSSGEPWFR